MLSVSGWSPFCHQLAMALPGAPTTNKQVLDKYLQLEQPDDGIMAEYVWIDGTGEGIRSKCKTLNAEPKSPKGK